MSKNLTLHLFAGLIASGIIACLPLTAMADSSVIENATARKSGDSWTFSVTLRHPDTGWEHYADGWQILSEDGESLGFRELLHPHVSEQPFTRSLSGVRLPKGTKRVAVAARCNVDGWEAPSFWIELD